MSIYAEPDSEILNWRAVEVIGILLWNEYCRPCARLFRQHVFQIWLLLILFRLNVIFFVFVLVRLNSVFGVKLKLLVTVDLIDLLWVYQHPLMIIFLVV
jgi:hypothetical protein